MSNRVPDILLFISNAFFLTLQSYLKFSDFIETLIPSFEKELKLVDSSIEQRPFIIVNIKS